MKKIYILIMIGTILSGLFIAGCYTDTIDAFSKFTFQLPLLFHSTHIDKAAPDISYDFANLNKYKEYTDNKDRISKALVLQFNYWIDSLILKDNIPFDSNNRSVIFNYIRFSLHFAKLKPQYSYYGEMDIDSSHWMFDPAEEPYLLGEFRNVNVADYYRKAYHIVEVADDVAQIISEAVKNRPAFYIITEYSPLADQDTTKEPKRHFPYVAARYDMIIRFSVDL
jgi:hypothetical protein